MKLITSRIIFSALLLAGFNLQPAAAQCPVITCPSTLTLPCSNGAGTAIIATSNYSANISSYWLGPGNINLVSSGTYSSVAYLNHAGTYTVVFKDNSTTCSVTANVLVTSPLGPTFNTSSPLSTGCTNSFVLAMFNTNTSPIPNGAVLKDIGPLGSTPSFTNTASTYTAPGCGDYQMLLKDAVTECVSSYSIHVSCINAVPNINIFTPGGDPLCIGNNASLFASGSAVTYTWNTGATTSFINVLPLQPTTYTVWGTNNFSCTASATIAAIDCSTITGLNPNALVPGNASFFPNPASGQLSLQTETEEPSSFSIFDINGRELITGNFRSPAVIDLSAFSSGIYVLRFGHEKEAAYRKLIIEK